LQQLYNTVFSVKQLHLIVVDKIADVRASTDGSSNPAFRPSLEDIGLNALKSVDLEEVAMLISSLPNKQCRSDPLPTWLLKECTVHHASA